MTKSGDNQDSIAQATRRVTELAQGFEATQLVYVAARLGIADELKDGPRAVDDLAAAVGAHPGSLRRVLNALASLGIFAFTGNGMVELTPTAQALRSDVTGSVRPWALMAGSEWMWRPWGELLHSVRTGETAFDYVYGRGLFEHLADDPDASKVFDDAMTSGSAAFASELTTAYDFSGISTLVDVAGGRGLALASILKANPHLRGVLVDLPHVIAEAGDVIKAHGVSDRCELRAGDFFESVPSGGDAYFLKWIIHDWDDERAATILRNCRRAIREDGRLLVAERLLEPRDEPSRVKRGDVMMMVMPGGRERTEAEYAALYEAAGFELTRVIKTESDFAIIEGVPV